ncbi:MAG: hotdog fold thioesterase [Chloroflexota bacterium]
MDEKTKLAIEKVIKNDPFADLLNVTVEEVSVGYGRVSMTIEPEHQNFHGMTHGGVIFSLGDIAFAIAGNSRGKTAVALNVDISFLQATQVGDKLVGEAKEISLNGPIGLYEITVTNHHNQDLIAKSQAVLYRKKDSFIGD